MTRSTRRQIQAQVLRLVSYGETLTQACRSAGVSTRAVRAWVQKDPEFAQGHAAARIAQAHAFVDKAIEISNEAVPANDSAAVQRNRLRVDTLKWAASKIAPKLYGDRVLAEAEIRPSGVIILPALNNSAATGLRAISSGQSQGSDANHRTDEIESRSFGEPVRSFERLPAPGGSHVSGGSVPETSAQCDEMLEEFRDLSWRHRLGFADE